ncbi:MAG TPA: T9SS type A sorting domain-containing protein, partial [Chitinophagaceae bacterium]
ESFSKIAVVKIRPGFSFALTSTRSEAIVNLQGVNGVVTIRMVTANGTTVLQQQKNITAGEQVRIPTGNLASGVYMIAVEYNNTVQTQRFVR